MKSIKQSLISITLGLFLAGTITLAQIWTGPTENPTGGNVPAPINTSPNDQTFTDSKSFNMKSDRTGVLNLFGALKLNGKFQIADGTEGVGKVLISDVNGMAEWATSTSISLENIRFISRNFNGYDSAGGVLYCASGEKIIGGGVSCSEPEPGVAGWNIMSSNRPHINSATGLEGWHSRCLYYGGENQYITAVTKAVCVK